MVKITVPVTTGGEQLADLLDEDTEYHGHQAAHDLRTQDGGEVELPTDGGEGGHVGEACAHNHRKTGTDLLEDGEQLEQGGDGGHHQAGLNEQGLLGVVQPAHAGDDDGGGDDAHHRGHHVLKPQGISWPGGGMEPRN